MIAGLFPSRRRPVAPARRDRNRRDARLDVQRLEERLALAIDVFQRPMNEVDTAPNNYAVLVLDEGDAGFLKKNATPSPSFTFANNSQFIEDGTSLTALGIPELLVDWGALTTFYVTSGKRVIYDGDPLEAEPPLGTTVAFPNDDGAIDVGTNSGIVPGTFSAILTVTNENGDTESGLVFASSPGATWNLNFSDDLGSLAPSRGNISERSGGVVLQWGTAPAAVTLRPIDWAVYTGPDDDVAPLSFTVSPGQTLTQSLRVDLARVTSTVTINSPVLAENGPGSTALFFTPPGSVAIASDTIVVNANTSSSSIFSVQSANLTVNRPVAAPRQSVQIAGTPALPGRVFVSEQGAFAGSIATPATTPAGSLNLEATHADVVFAGIVNATEQTYLLQSPLDPRAYTMTTVSPTSGVQAGRILGDTVGITLANDAGGEVNLRTTVTTLRMTASSTPSVPALPYAISVSEADDLTVDAVPASRRPIVIDAAGTLTLASSVQTVGDMTLSARNQLALTGAISSAAGSIALVSDGITASGPITAGGTRGVSMQSRADTGDVVLGGLVRAGGTAKIPVRVATTASVDLATGGLLTIDGVALVAGDRVLVKNQDNPAENGIYVAVSGTWSRATDANTAQLFVPGFTLGVLEGTQEGVWAFANAANPTLEQTGLSFAPASATQIYVPARAATTGNVNLAVGGLLTVDGVALADGDRVLVKDQANPRQNGIYVAGTGAWVRASDADTVPELVAGSYVFVTSGGAVNGGKGFVLRDDAVQVGITPLAFESFAVQATRTNNYSPANVLGSVVAATTVHIDLAGPPAEIDGIDLAPGDLLLVKNQFDAAANGVYVYAPGGLTRWPGADSSSALARGTMVFVAGGATNAGTSWTFNDTVDLIGRTTAGSLQVTGLASTQYLAAGMLVTGPGIPANTKIDIVIDGTSVRLTKAALATSTSAVLGFMQTSAVAVGSTPILFVPTGGTVAVTAGRSITSSTTSPTSRITAATALLTAGLPQTGTADAASLVDVNSAVGRLSASAPSSVAVSDSGAIDLFDVRASGGGVAVDAQGTITGRSVSAVGGTAPADITLASLYGDVVAATVSSSVGTIDLVSTNERVVVRRLGLNAASVRAQEGDVVVVADTGGIRLEGPVQAGGTDGDVTLQSINGGLTVQAPGAIQASDRLTVVTPNAVPTLGAGATVAAAALSITSQFGPGATAPPAGFGTYSTLNVNRTDPGSIDMSSPSALVIEGASTVAGSILFTAPSISVVGPVTAGTEAAGDGDITLTATTGAISLAGSLTARNDTVRLVAPGGSITQTAGTIDCGTFVWTAPAQPTLLPGNTFGAIGINLTSPGDVRIPGSGTQSGTLLLGRVSTVDGNVVIDAESVVISDLVQAGGAGTSVSITARGGDISFVSAGRVDQAAGVVTLSAAGRITSTTAGANVTTAGGLSATAASGVALRTTVNSLAAAVGSGDLVITETDALVLAGVTARDITLRTTGAVTQTAAVVGRLLDVGAGAAGDILLDTSANDVDTLAVASGRIVRFTDSDGLAVGGTGITAADDVTLTTETGNIAVNGSILAPGRTVRLDASQGLITQASGTTIDSRAFVWFATAQPALDGTQTYSAIGINLTAPGDVRIPAAGSQPGALEVVGASTVDGNVEIDAGSVLISDLVRAGGAGRTATVTARTGNLSFTGPGRIETETGLVTLSAASGAVSLVNGGSLPVVTSGGGLTVDSLGTVQVGTATASGPIAITSGGDVRVGPQVGGLLESTASIDLRNVSGAVVVENGGRIVAPTVLLAPGKTIEVGDALNVSTAAALNAIIESINSLPANVTTPYQIVVTASFTLTQTLVVNRPIALWGTSTNIVLSGDAAVKTGIQLGPEAIGSSVRRIAFRNFATEAIRIDNARNVRVTNVRVVNSGTGIAIYGAANGTVVQGNTLDRNVSGVRLASATGVLVGGAAAGQGNVITNSRRQGIVATGFCTGSRLVKNRITGRTPAYNVSSSRGLRIVR